MQSKQHQGSVAIGKPERQVRKASRCGSKQQKRSHAIVTLLLFVRDTYIWVLFFAHIPFVVNRTFNAKWQVATVQTCCKLIKPRKQADGSPAHTYVLVSSTALDRLSLLREAQRPLIMKNLKNNSPAVDYWYFHKSSSFSGRPRSELIEAAKKAGVPAIAFVPDAGESNENLSKRVQSFFVWVTVTVASTLFIDTGTISLCLPAATYVNECTSSTVLTPTTRTCW